MSRRKIAARTRYIDRAVVCLCPGKRLLVASESKLFAFRDMYLLPSSKDASIHGGIMKEQMLMINEHYPMYKYAVILKRGIFGIQATNLTSGISLLALLRLAFD